MKNLFKHLLALCLALALCLSLTAMSAGAAEASPFELDISDGGDGTLIVSLICRKAVPDFGAADAVIDWEGRSHITLLSIKGVALKDLTPNVVAGRFAASAKDYLSGDNLEAGAVWVKYTFRVEPSVPSGTYTFTVTFENGVDIGFRRCDWANAAATGSCALEASPNCVRFPCQESAKGKLAIVALYNGDGMMLSAGVGAFDESGVFLMVEDAVRQAADHAKLFLLDPAAFSPLTGVTEQKL